MQELHELSRKVLGAAGLEGLLQDVLDVAVATVEAKHGALHLWEGNSLRMAAQKGHEESFLNFFKSREFVPSICREAARRGERIVVPDVETSELFAGAESQAVLRGAGVRAVQSTPMISRSGKTVGVLTTDWGEPHTPDECELMRIDLVARQAADLIEMARAEDQLRNSESTLFFYENAPLMMGVVEIPADDSDIIHIYDNPATDRFFGRPHGSTVGQSSMGMGSPKEATQFWIENYRLAEREGNPVQFEYWHAHPNGPVWLSAVVAKVGSGESGRTKFSYAVADVTARKQVEEALRATEERLTLATLGGDLGFWDWDIAHNKAHLSPKYYAMTGYQEGEVQVDEKFFRELIHPEDFASVEGAAAAHIRGETDYAITEYRMRRKTGDYRWIRGVGKIVARDAQGAPMRMAGVIADITVQKKTEAILHEQLAHASRVSTMGKLASSIAHELNQPLGAILYSVDAAELLLEQAPQQKEQLREILEDIRKENRRAGDVIQSMRTLLLKQEIEHQQLKINFLTEEVLRFLKEDAVSHKIKITTELAPQLPAVNGNRVQLQQVILNFIMNAMEAMAEQPTERRSLTVATRLATGGGVEVCVSDLGPGIDPANLPRLFQPFFSTKQSGLGIGLWVAEKIVTAHKGRIWAENRPAGGAAFHFVLPAVSDQSAPEQT